MRLVEVDVRAWRVCQHTWMSLCKIWLRLWKSLLWNVKWCQFRGQTLLCGTHVNFLKSWNVLELLALCNSFVGLSLGLGGSYQLGLRNASAFRSRSQKAIALGSLCLTSATLCDSDITGHWSLVTVFYAVLWLSYVPCLPNLARMAHGSMIYQWLSMYLMCRLWNDWIPRRHRAAESCDDVSKLFCMS